MSKPTRGQKVNADISALLRARNTLLWISTREEARVERALIEICGAIGFRVRFWDSSVGIVELGERDGKPVVNTIYGPSSGGGVPENVAGFIRSNTEKCVYVLRDLPTTCGARGGAWGDANGLRAFKTLARDLQSVPPNQARSLVVLTSSGEIPPELSMATTIDYPIPDRTEIAQILADTIEALNPDIREKAAPDAIVREAAIDAAIGLTADEADNCFARSLVLYKKIDPATIAAEKKRVIAREKVLSWFDPDPRGMDAVGGLDVLKNWLGERKNALSERAREYGLPSPKGMLLVGIPGTGKSLTAKCVASAWGVPLLRLDLGAIKSKWVGESEANIRKALQIAEAIGKCVLWIDEIEKALAGSTGPQGDGGVSSDALGAVLSWMQEQSGVFVIATANDVTGLPPELLRKGRFDEIFWTDLPTQAERVEILRASLAKYKRNPESIKLTNVAAKTAGFVGAEIEALVPDALFAAFADKEREITTEDLLAAAEKVTPLSKTAEEKITRLRTWADGRARRASSKETAAATKGRILDMS